MANNKEDKDKTVKRTKKKPPAVSKEARELELESLAYDLAEKKLRDGTASSQLISHFLKLSAEREKNKEESDLRKGQIDLMKAKKDNLGSAKRIEELYSSAMTAFAKYSGGFKE